MTAKIENLKDHYSNGLEIDGELPAPKVIDILEKEKPGSLVKITWTVDGRSYSAKAGNLDEIEIPFFKCSPSKNRNSLLDRLLKRPASPLAKRFINFHLLPDHSGFIRFESGWDRSDNCILLDAYGKERMRLSVPWRLTGATNPEAEQASTFDNIDGPYTNPATGEEGQFGVTGWVGEAKYYFELDYHTGQFLWCKPIRD